MEQKLFEAAKKEAKRELKRKMIVGLCRVAVMTSCGIAVGQGVRAENTLMMAIGAVIFIAYMVRDFID